MLLSLDVTIDEWILMRGSNRDNILIEPIKNMNPGDGIGIRPKNPESPKPESCDGQ